MNKKIIIASIAGAAIGGIAIYLVSKMIVKNKKRAMLRRSDKLGAAKPGNTYAYEYTL